MSLDQGISTRAIHAGQEATQWKSWAVVPPISLSTTFAQPEPARPIVSINSLTITNAIRAYFGVIFFCVRNSNIHEVGILLVDVTRRR